MARGRRAACHPARACGVWDGHDRSESAFRIVCRGGVRLPRARLLLAIDGANKPHRRTGGVIRNVRPWFIAAYCAARGLRRSTANVDLVFFVPPDGYEAIAKIGDSRELMIIC